MTITLTSLNTESRRRSVRCEQCRKILASLRRGQDFDPYRFEGMEAGEFQALARKHGEEISLTDHQCKGEK